MVDFNLKKYLAENKLLKDSNLPDGSPLTSEPTPQQHTLTDDELETIINQRIIEELENFEKNEFRYAYGDEFTPGVYYIQHRIKELKQKI